MQEKYDSAVAEQNEVKKTDDMTPSQRLMSWAKNATIATLRKEGPVKISHPVRTGHIPFMCGKKTGEVSAILRGNGVVCLNNRNPSVDEEIPVAMLIELALSGQSDSVTIRVTKARKNLLLDRKALKKFLVDAGAMNVA